MERLTCTDARRIDLVIYLAALGHEPQRINHQDYWYLSPLREEKTASFKVNRKLNLWYDHGLGKGGNLVDFGMLYFRCSVSELLQRLSGNDPLNLSFQPLSLPAPATAGEKKETDDSKITILAVRQLAAVPLLHYLNGRGIPADLAQRCCKEVDFSLYRRIHTAIGFENNSGGYELRSPWFKGSSAPKDLTLIRDNEADGPVHVLEGFIDFLSLALIHEQRGPQNYLVLNSLSFVEKSVAILRNFPEIFLYLDHNPAGRKSTLQLQEQLPQTRDASELYQGHEDLNDLLKHSLTQKPPPQHKQVAEKTLKKGRGYRR